MIESLTTLATSLGLGIGAGVNAYATFLVYGVLARFYPGVVDGELATFFASTPMLIAMGVLYTIEFVADKIPAVDHVWDVVHTFVRPAAGALIAFGAASPEIPRPVVLLASIVAGGAALGAHFTKAGFRVASTTTTLGTANPVISLVEDVFAVVMSLIAVLLPFLLAALLIVLVTLLLIRRSRQGAKSVSG